MGICIEYTLKVSDYPNFADVKRHWFGNEGSFDSELTRSTKIGQDNSIHIYQIPISFLSKNGAKDYVINQRRNTAFVLKFLGSKDLYENDPKNPKLLSFFNKIKELKDSVVEDVKKEENKLNSKKFLICPHCGSKLSSTHLIEAEQYKWRNNSLPFVKYDFDKQLANNYGLPDDQWLGLYDENISEIMLSCPICKKGNLVTNSFFNKISKKQEKTRKLITNCYNFRTSNEKEEYWLIYGEFSTM